MAPPIVDLPIEGMVMLQVPKNICLKSATNWFPFSMEFWLFQFFNSRLRVWSCPKFPGHLSRKCHKLGSKPSPSPGSMASGNNDEILFTSDASTPEILRAAKKDESHVIALASKFRVLAQKILGPRTWVLWRRELDLLAELAYHGVTTMAGLQTLGEEYMYLLQIYSSKQTSPSRFRHLVYLTLNILIPYISDKCLKMSLINTDCAIAQFLRRSASRYLYRLHLAIFYISASGYYSLSKRLTKIKYLSLRQQMDDDDPATIELSNWFKVVGYLSIIEMIYTFGAYGYNYFKQKRLKLHASTSVKNSPNDATRFTCDICLDDQATPCCAPCGHLSCWKCLLTAASTGNKACHVCRTALEPCRIIPLMNL